MEWNETKWNGMKWNGMEHATTTDFSSLLCGPGSLALKQQSIGLGWIWLDGLELIWLEFIKWIDLTWHIYEYMYQHSFQNGVKPIAGTLIHVFQSNGGGMKWNEMKWNIMNTNEMEHVTALQFLLLFDVCVSSTSMQQ